MYKYDMLDLTPILKLYSHYRLNQQKKINTFVQQEKELFSLLLKAKDTKFGKDHGFSSIKSILDYQRNVPLRKYEDFWQEYWKPCFPILNNCTWPGLVKKFPVTSGTTSGTTKYIPLTAEMEKSNTKSAFDLLAYHIDNYKNSSLLSGKNFFLGGSTNFVKEAPNVVSGDLSGMVAKNIPFFIKPFYFPPEELALISNWEEKIAVFAEKSLNENIKLISGVPAWMLLFFDKLFELRPEAERKLQNIFPNLEVIVHGGVNFAPYLKQFQQLIIGSKVQFREVYPASEGFLAIGDKGYNEGLRLNIDNGIFYEFIPVEELDSKNPTRHWIATVEKDVNYAIVLTTCAGLWSYIIGDTIKFVDTANPKILITGRTSYSLSAFGEHLIAEEIDDGITTAANDINLSVPDYSVGPIFPSSEKELGGHLYFVEFKERLPIDEEIKRFSQILDRRLCERNEDYKAHRADGFGLNPPSVIALPAGTFANWMKSRGKLGGQNKVPRIITDLELFKNLQKFCKDSNE